MNAFERYILAYTQESRVVVYASLFFNSLVYLSRRRRVLINLDNKKTFIVYWAITSILNLLIYHQVNCGKQIACFFCFCYIFSTHYFSFYGVYTCVIPSRRGTFSLLQFYYVLVYFVRMLHKA